MQHKLLLTLLLSIINIAYADFLPRARNVPGGVAHVTITAPTKPSVFYGKHQAAVIKSDQENNWLAVVGIPVSTNIKNQILQVKTPQRAQVSFDIITKNFSKQQITIRDRKYQKISAEDQKRISKEAKNLTKILTTWSEINPFQVAFQLPVKGVITSYFGAKRFYNGKLGDPHTGLDIAAAAGTEVKNPVPGVVIATTNWFYTGNTVIIDHGQGLLTMYAHLQEIMVKPGQHLAQGKIIGLVGKTGRVTGAHLHWSVALTGTWVDPLLFVDASDL